ncbi:MAG: hypothetical protein V1932_00020 [Chloroflexota bacterium]
MWVERFFLDFRCLKCFVTDVGEPVAIGVLKGVPSHLGWFLKELLAIT